MSLQNETLDLHKSPNHAEDAPSLEYRAVGHDSLSMFLSAIGGAILGVLLTLLILAIINDGTLNFTGNARMTALEGTVTRVNENVGTLSSNMDVVAAELASIRSGLSTAQQTLQAVSANQDSQMTNVAAQMEGVREAISTLDVTRERFDTFVGALSSALAEMEEVPATQP